MNFENDPEIKVTIQTPTSTRAGNLRDLPLFGDGKELSILQDPPSLVSHIDPLVYTNTFSNPFVSIPTFTNDQFYSIINSTLYQDNQLHRQSIDVDIEPRHSKTSDLSSECSICCKNFELKEKLSTLECGHTFHYPCLLEWGKYKPECPLCRKKIPIVER